MRAFLLLLSVCLSFTCTGKKLHELQHPKQDKPAENNKDSDAKTKPTPAKRRKSNAGKAVKANGDDEAEEEELLLNNINSNSNGNKTNGSNNRGSYGPTLIITPTSAMPQWEQEIKDFALEGSLKVSCYYGNRDKVQLCDLLDSDVVLTTYPIVEYEYR